MENSGSKKAVFSKYTDSMIKPSKDGKGSQARVVDAITARANILQRKIEFHKAIKTDIEVDILKSKYIPLNPNSTVTVASKVANGQAGPTKAKAGKAEEEDLNVPKYEIFPESNITGLLKWEQVGRIGAGLNNLGNTCFLNSVLQCLTYTPPLANYAVKKEHSKTCQRKGQFCIFCSMETQIATSLKNGNSLSPKGIVGNLKNISPSLRVGRQEDSHEFIRYVIEGMQKMCLQGLPKNLEARIAETTVVHRIFGGYLQSQVHCSQCDYKSNTFDPFMDLSLEIKGCNSLENAFQQFTRPEILDKENKYKCPRCSKLVQAKKQFTIRKAPNVLTIQLKRFKFGFGGFGSNSGKISKKIEFGDRLNLKPYMSKVDSNNGKDVLYRLYAVLVHDGGSTRSGHYYCFVKNSNDMWYCMNDSSVRQVSFQTVCNESAYMLFYVRDPGQIPKAIAQKRKAESVEKADMNDNNSVNSQSSVAKAEAPIAKKQKVADAPTSTPTNVPKVIPEPPKPTKQVSTPAPRPANGTPVPQAKPINVNTSSSPMSPEKPLTNKQLKKQKRREEYQRKMAAAAAAAAEGSSQSSPASPIATPAPSQAATKKTEAPSTATQPSVKTAKVVPAPTQKSSPMIEAPSTKIVDKNDNSASSSVKTPVVKTAKVLMKDSKESQSDSADDADMDDVAQKKAPVKKKEGSVTNWDESIVDDWKLKDVEKRRTVKTGVRELKKQLYQAPQVSAWDEADQQMQANAEEIDKEIEREMYQGVQNKRRTKLDEELDQGRVKKIKKKMPFLETNVFQKRISSMNGRKGVRKQGLGWNKDKRNKFSSTVRRKPRF